MKYTEENIEKLAKDVVDSWDMEDLILFAINALIQTYKDDKESFDNDTDLMYK